MSVLTKPLDPLSEARICLPHVNWQQYETLIAMFGDRPHLRLTYLEGNLEIMTISPGREMLKKMIARLIEVYALERDINLFSCGSATFRREAAARGLEPDESYCIGTRKELPDLAIEVVISSGSIGKLKVYQGLGVKEVWFWQDNRFSLYRLNDSSSDYDSIERSTFFPDLDFTLLATYIQPEAEPQAVKAFLQALRQQGSK
ncbi:Uma2 family endonuclease [Trichothermofontia sichuanensis B231]|uniref:Uma2 family endonuclease n=1 Tax=Trichothermofontia sichuanensis TaxID=3045816 RepID=UPI0022460037|nr:Uma2 family endonuclease [Trichothermofontia sichuanensis]UZQ53320.1 Uma2 family endonuclease [Trichothermofontia sichuanensis B231]